jgi:hypothetical protein
MIDPTIEAVIAAATEAGSNGHTDAYPLSDPEPEWSAFAAAKLRDALVAGFEPEFSPHEADAAGAFLEDALREEDARETGPARPRRHAAALPLKA